MRKFNWRHLALGLVFVFGVMSAASMPARAGDDDECLATTIGQWTVVYDKSCSRTISRTLEASTSVSIDLSKGSQRPAVKITPPGTATSLEIRIGNRSLGAVVKRPGGGFWLSDSAANEVFAALRNGGGVMIVVKYSSGSAAALVLRGDNFEAAYQRLLR